MLKESRLKPFKSELSEEYLQEQEEQKAPIIRHLQKNIEVRDTPIVKQLKNGLRIKRD